MNIRHDTESTQMKRAYSRVLKWNGLKKIKNRNRVARKTRIKKTAKYKTILELRKKIMYLAGIFGLNPIYALEYIEHTEICLDREVWVVEPSIKSLKKYFPKANDGDVYKEAIKLLLKKLSKYYEIHRHISVSPEFLSTIDRTRNALRQFENHGDIIIFPAVLHGNILHDLIDNGFGLRLFDVLSIILTSQGELKNMAVDMPGDIYSKMGNRNFSYSPNLIFNSRDKKIIIDSHSRILPLVDSGQATGLS